MLGQRVAPLTANRVVIATEAGEKNCDGRFIRNFLEWAEANRGLLPRMDLQCLGMWERASSRSATIKEPRQNQVKCCCEFLLGGRVASQRGFRPTWASRHAGGDRPIRRVAREERTGSSSRSPVQFALQRSGPTPDGRQGRIPRTL